jgi:sRNA-binding protein
MAAARILHTVLFMSWGTRLSTSCAVLALILLSGMAVAVAAPANDDFSNAGTLSGAAGSASGSNVEAARKRCRKAKRRIKKAKKRLKKARKSRNKAKLRRAKKGLKKTKGAKRKACRTAPPSPAMQPSGPITGTLSQPGYTVIALPASGPGRATLAGTGAFELNPPATEVTLHLRAPNGTYAGPIVLEESGNPVGQAEKNLKKAAQALRRTMRKLKVAKRQAKKAKRKAKKAAGKKGVKQTRRSLKRANKRVKKAKRRLRKARRTWKVANWTLTRASERAKGLEAILGIKAGAKLGSVVIDSARGYATAKLTEQHWSEWVDEKRGATAATGVPIGAGNFGRVRAAELGSGAPGDLDRDGVPNALDIDDDGDLVLDNLDPSPSGAGASSSSAFARVSQAGQQFASGDFVVSPLMTEGLFQAANANMPGLTDAQIEAALPTTGDLHISTSPVESSELDCGQLVYCTLGGTGTIWDAIPPISDPSEWLHFPECCDPDGDGMGSVVPAPPESVAARDGGFGVVRFRHGARSDQIRSGDVLIQRIKTAPGSPEEALVATVQYVFVTTPALVSFSDGQGTSVTIPYPVSHGDPGSVPEHPYPVKAGPDGHVVLTLTGWRPQRKPIPTETGDWIDMGGLNYVMSAYTESLGPFGCGQSYYSSTDPNLVPAETFFGGGFRDLSSDRPANPSNTFSYRLDLTGCLGSKGVSFEPGEVRDLKFEAGTSQPNAWDNASVQIYLERAP